MKIDNKISAIVTGAAYRLGEATFRALASEGVKVSIFDLDEARGNSVVDAIGGTFCKVNVTSDDSADEGFEKARAADGQERIFINCVGIGNAVRTASRDRVTGAIKHILIVQFNRVVQVNLIGTFCCIAKSATGMLSIDTIDGERGVTVNTASIAAEDSQIGQAAYAASKGGVVGMTLQIARDLARELIRINTIMPSLFKTLFLAGLPQKAIHALNASLPNPARLGDPAEDASLAVEMVRNGYFNGALVRVDGTIRISPK